MTFPQIAYSIFIVFLLFNPIATAEEHTNISESKRVESLENTIRQSANMTYSNYKFYPFAIATTHEFIVSQDEQGDIRGEVSVKWVDGEADRVTFPTFIKE